MEKVEFHNMVSNEQPNICQIVCYKGNKKIYSDVWNNYKENDAVHIMSVIKSIVSLLIGICVDKGWIKSIDNKILDYFPNYKVKRGEKTIYEVTIRHIMTMKAPLKCKYDPWVKVCSSEDWTIASLDFIGGRKGIINQFQYNTVCLHILTGIITKVSNMPVVEFANTYLFKPLGIVKHRHYLADTAEEHKTFTISKTPKDHIWFGDPQGVGTAGYGLCMSANDLAKIGLMCLNNGNYNNKQIVSEKWIKEMLEETQTTDGQFRHMGYGLLWWIIDSKKGIYAAIGNSGNIIYMNRSNQFVCAITGYFKPTIVDRVDFIQKNIEPFMNERDYKE